MKKIIYFIAVLFILLVISMPITFAQLANYQDPNPYSTPASQRASSDPQSGSSLGGYVYTQNPLTEQLRRETGTFSYGPEQYLGEAIIFNVANYEPKQIRESALEQGDMPIFFYLKGTDFGTVLSPLTNDPSAQDPLSGITRIPPIDRIDVQLNSSSPDYKYVRFVRYIKPNRPTLSNLGMLMVVVKKLPDSNSTISDNTIVLDFNAKVYLRLEENNLLGVSKQDLVVKEFPIENEFLDHKEEYSIFSGKGYVRATRIGGNSVTLQVYNKNLYPVSYYSPTATPATAGLQRTATVSLNLNGPPSQPLSFGYTGNPLNDIFTLRLEGVSSPSNKAEIDLQLEGRKVTRKISEGNPLYAGSDWIVKSATIGSSSIKSLRDDNDIEAIAKEYGLNTQAKNQIARLMVDFTGLEIREHTLVLENKISGNRKTIKRNVISDPSGSRLAVEIDPIQSNTAQLLEGVYCEGNANVPLGDFACEAVKRYKELIKQYPTSQEAERSKRDLAEIYDGAMIEFTPCVSVKNADNQAKGTPAYLDNLEKCLQYQLDMRDLAFYYYSQIGEKSAVNTRLGGKGGAEFLEDEGISIQLVSVITKDSEKPSFSGKIFYDAGRTQDISNIKIGEEVQGLNVDYEGNTQDYVWRVESISPAVISLKLYSKAKSSDGNTTRYNAAPKPPISLKLNERNAVPTTYPKPVQGTAQGSIGRTDVIVTDIKSMNEAYLTVIPGAGRGVTTSSFRVNIPVDPRPFKWTPEKLQSQIDTTRNIINELDKIINKLDRVISTWKKLCLGVFALLTLKNSFTGVRNIARRQVSESYKAQCQTEIAEGTFKTQQRCLSEYEDEMQKAIDRTETHMSEINSQIKGKTIDDLTGKGITTEKCGDFDKFGEASKALGVNNQDTLRGYRDCWLYSKVQADTSLSADYKEYIEKKVDEIGVNKRVKLYDQAKTVAAALGDNLDPNNKEDLKKIMLQLDYYQEEEQDPQLKQVYLKIDQSSKDSKVGNWYKKGYAILKDPTTPGGFKSSEMKGLSEYEYVVYENNLDSADKVKSHVCTNFVGNARWENNNCYDNNVQGSTSNRSEPVATKITELKGKPSQQNAYQRFVSQDFYAQTFDEANGILKTGINSADCLSVKGTFANNQCKPVYYSSLALVDSAGRNINPSYSGNSLPAYYDNDGFAYCYPIGNGNYAIVLDRYQGPNSLVKDITVRNVGSNGRIECGNGDDELVYTEDELNLPANKNKKDEITRKAPTAKCTNPGKTQVGSVDGKSVLCQAGKDIPGLSSLAKPKCTDAMDPADCKWLFNFCDPVQCPSSRCTLGGRVPERNVIQSGISGSILLCLPNIKEGIAVPICVTGVSAGLKNIKSILEGYAGCLEVNLKENKNVGFCDYIRSVGICEMVWREAYNLVDIGGRGLIDWASGNIFGEGQGGGEYLSFQSSLQNVGDSVRVFTEEYKNTYTAQFLSQSTEDIGTQLCRLSVNGKLPSVGKILDQLTEPENPPQFTAFFDETPYASPGEVLPTATIPGNAKDLSLYKVFYHIYAGSGFYQGTYSQPQSLFNPGAQAGPGNAVTYSVYLVNKEAGLPPLYVTFPDQSGYLPQTMGKVEPGKFQQQTVQKPGTKGYNQICVNINGVEQCGFGKVSTDFGFKELQEAITADEAKEKITTADECVPDDRRAPSYSLAKLGALAGSQIGYGASGAGILQAQPNAIGTGLLTSDLEKGLFSTGIVRVCAVEPPTTEAGRWQTVGTCGNDERGKTLGTCWLDTKSYNIENAERNQDLVKQLKERAGPNIEIIESEQSKEILFALNEKRNVILEQIRSEVNKAKKEGTTESLAVAAQPPTSQPPQVQTQQQPLPPVISSCLGFPSDFTPVNQNNIITCTDSICCVQQETVAKINELSNYISNSNQYKDETIIIRDAGRTVESQKEAYLAYKSGNGPVACGPSDESRIDDISAYSNCPHVIGKAIDISLGRMSSNPREITEEQVITLRNLMCEVGWVNFGGEWWHYEYNTNQYRQAVAANKCYYSALKYVVDTSNPKYA